ncbi:MAG TPA: acyl-CoA dehydrogenase family protein [Nocardioides sp.]|nr:acyl-CoA dehydrogenase family protein [Nocardioides sp.]
MSDAQVDLLGERMSPEDRKPFADAVTRAMSSLAGADLETALVDIGWRDALPDYPADAVAVVFEAQGRARATTASLGAVLADALGVGDAAVVVLPALGATAAPGLLRDGVLDVRGLVLGGAPSSGDAVVVAADGDGWQTVTVPSAALQVQPVQGIDRDLGIRRVEASALSPGTTPGAAPWDDAVAAGQRALAHELVGLSRAMLDLAREHALAREQFGRPIATFQAVRHKLAESLVAIEAAEAAAGAAWEAPGPLSASIAKALAGQSARTVAKHAQQVLAGMGFTTEHAFHTYFRRVLVLDQLLGSSRLLTEELGRQLLASRKLPGMLPL